MQEKEKATEVFRNLIEEKLSKPDGTWKRGVYLRAADEPFDQYGRLLVCYPQTYFKVKPCNRIFMWPEDATEAVGRLNLSPAE